jgi:hypothetical protein
LTAGSADGEEHYVDDDVVAVDGGEVVDGVVAEEAVECEGRELVEAH